MSASICLSRGSSSWGCRRVKRGISILLRDARKALRKGSAGHSAAGLGSSPFSSLVCSITHHARQLFQALLLLSGSDYHSLSQ